MNDALRVICHNLIFYVLQGDQENSWRLQVQDIQGWAGERYAAGHQRPPRVPGGQVQDGGRDRGVLRGEPEVWAAQDAERASGDTD